MPRNGDQEVLMRLNKYLSNILIDTEQDICVSVILHLFTIRISVPVYLSSKTMEVLSWSARYDYDHIMSSFTVCLREGGRGRYCVLVHYVVVFRRISDRT